MLPGVRRLGSEQMPEEKQRGPIVLRRGQIEHSTTDQRLLDTRGPSDWVHTDPWRVLRIQAEFVEGFGLLSELPRAVCVFGSAPAARTGGGTLPFRDGWQPAREARLDGCRALRGARDSGCQLRAR